MAKGITSAESTRREVEGVSYPHLNFDAHTMPKVIRTKPELWEACKNEVLSKLGKFSARAMQQAVVLYKKRGGEYVSEKDSKNPLTVWNKNQQSKKSNIEIKKKKKFQKYD